MNEKKIIGIWKAFRESGNPHEGKLTRTMFKKVCLYQLGESDISFKNDHLVEAIFERFKIDRNVQIFFFFYYFKKKTMNLFLKTESSREEDKIELQDLVISLTVLSRMSQDSKLSCFFFRFLNFS